MKALFIRLKTNSPVLFYCGMAHLALSILLLIISQVDQRQLLGINLWVKPIKFALSIGIYGLTWAWLLQYLPFKKAKLRFAYFTAFAMMFEMSAIGGQAARGQLSHFNLSTSNNAMLFQAMGVVIVLQTLFAIYMGILFFRVKSSDTLSPSLLWGIRLGILVACILAFEGGVMGRMMAHTVGAADGSKGLPYVNWSRQHGDLRIAHFAGLHALQILPLFALWVAPRSRFVTISFCLVYFAFVSWLFINALHGHPLF